MENGIEGILNKSGWNFNHNPSLSAPSRYSSHHKFVFISPILCSPLSPVSYLFQSPFPLPFIAHSATSNAHYLLSAISSSSLKNREIFCLASISFINKTLCTKKCCGIFNLSTFKRKECTPCLCLPCGFP